MSKPAVIRHTLARAVIIAAGLGLCGCTPQRSASLMPMLGMGNSMASQGMNLYLQEERLQQELLLLQQQRLRNQ
jgi:hypothetical protein